MQRRIQRRATTGKALAELLEIRHYLRGIELVFTEIRRRFNTAPKDLLTGVTWLEQLLPPDPGLPQRYEDAVSELARTTPLQLPREMEEYLNSLGQAASLTPGTPTG